MFLWENFCKPFLGGVLNRKQIFEVILPTADPDLDLWRASRTPLRFAASSAPFLREMIDCGFRLCAIDYSLSIASAHDCTARCVLLQNDLSFPPRCDRLTPHTYLIFPSFVFQSRDIHTERSSLESETMNSLKKPNNPNKECPESP